MGGHDEKVEWGGGSRGRRRRGYIVVRGVCRQVWTHGNMTVLARGGKGATFESVSALKERGVYMAIHPKCGVTHQRWSDDQI
jgi:hypothetical protein